MNLQKKMPNTPISSWVVSEFINFFIMRFYFSKLEKKSLHDEANTLIDERNKDVLLELYDYVWRLQKRKIGTLITFTNIVCKVYKRKPPLVCQCLYHTSSLGYDNELHPCYFEFDSKSKWLIIRSLCPKKSYVCKHETTYKCKACKVDHSSCPSPTDPQWLHEEIRKIRDIFLDHVTEKHIGTNDVYEIYKLLNNYTTRKGYNNLMLWYIFLIEYMYNGNDFINVEGETTSLERNLDKHLKSLIAKDERQFENIFREIQKKIRRHVNKRRLEGGEHLNKGDFGEMCVSLLETIE